MGSVAALGETSPSYQKEDRVGALLAVVKAPPLTYADIEAAWKSNPYITYNELASYFDVGVIDLMRVIDAHIAKNPAPRDPN